MGEKTIVQNRRARHDYHILEQFETGIALQGTEVKSIRAGQITLKDSYAEVDGGELFLIGVHIAPTSRATSTTTTPNDDANSSCINARSCASATPSPKRLTLVPLRVYFKDGRAKVELGLCRGKHTIDKRQTSENANKTAMSTAPSGSQAEEIELPAIVAGKECESEAQRSADFDYEPLVAESLQLHLR